ncbi:DUF1129 family protein [Paenibacillus bovis]|uniref:DUF1129 domain-containing protein n=1 Tax=Paenibacillus bovis TaxID=1616788 RepID=A0A172ZD87_9BACL|nr:DUF1129 family protein [Paenibacillus bovis]ANF95624.1 hypothetical protein AR543_06165 [Paenibacillus bovis]
MSTVRHLVKDINSIRDQLKQDNLSYYDDVIVHVRDARIRRESGEELLLEMGQHLLEAQQRGKTARQLFGKESDIYADQLIENLPEARQLSKPMYYLMIVWVALTWVFLLQALMGFFKINISGSGVVGEISLSTLILVAAGAVVLVELVRRVAEQPAEKSELDRPRMQINGRSVVSYLVIMIAIIVVGTYLRNVMPVLVISPWVSLILCIIGILGQKFIFMRR